MHKIVGRDAPGAPWIKTNIKSDSRCAEGVAPYDTIGKCYRTLVIARQQLKAKWQNMENVPFDKAHERRYLALMGFFASY